MFGRKQKKIKQEPVSSGGVEGKEESEQKPAWFDLQSDANKREPRNLRGLISGKKYWGDKDFPQPS